MPSNYGIGHYGHSVYSDGGIRDFSGTLPVAVTLAGVIQRWRNAFSSTLSIPVTLSGSIGERWRHAAGILAVPVTLEGALLVPRTYALEGTLVVPVAMEGAMAATKSFEGGIDVGVELVSEEEYLGQFWRDRDPTEDQWTDAGAVNNPWGSSPAPEKWN